MCEIKELIEKYSNYIAHVAKKFESKRVPADDIFQLVMVCLLSASKFTYRSDPEFRGYVCRIIRNVSISLGRARRREKENGSYTWPLALPDELIASSSVDSQPMDVLVRGEQVERMHRALMRLNEERRTIITLIYFEGLSRPDIASCLGISIDKVYRETHLAIKQLRELLSDLDNNDKTSEVGA